MEERKPLKRHEALKPVSREHHHGLLLSWKIRQGLKQGIELHRIKSYTDWFWQQHLKPHFEFEENYVFPILGKDHVLVERALQEHKRLESLFNADDKITMRLKAIEKELKDHIRFEERILFELLQEEADEGELEMVMTNHEQLTNLESWEDEFWSQA